MKSHVAAVSARRRTWLEAVHLFCYPRQVFKLLGLDRDGFGGLDEEEFISAFDTPLLLH